MCTVSIGFGERSLVCVPVLLQHGASEILVLKFIGKVEHFPAFGLKNFWYCSLEFS